MEYMDFVKSTITTKAIRRNGSGLGIINCLMAQVVYLQMTVDKKGHAFVPARDSKSGGAFSVISSN